MFCFIPNLLQESVLQKATFWDMTLDNVLLVKKKSIISIEWESLVTSEESTRNYGSTMSRKVSWSAFKRDRFFWIMVQFKSNLLRGIAFILIINLDKGSVCLYVSMAFCPFVLVLAEWLFREWRHIILPLCRLCHRIPNEVRAMTSFETKMVSVTKIRQIFKETCVCQE